VTVPRRPATWDEIEAFCQADGWSQVRVTDHIHWEKRLPSGELLQTHRSFGGGMSQDLFSLILREQLKVNRGEFWRVLAEGGPAQRPSVPPEPEPSTYPAWVVDGLLKQGLTEAAIREMTPDEAQALLYEKWSGQSGSGDS
jgi:hypothetical protein